MRSKLVLLTGIATALTLSCDPSGQMSDFQNFAVYNQSPDRVLEALTAELVSRDALTSELASELGGSLLDAFAAGGPTQFNSESVAQTRNELAALVPEEFRHFIGDEGGRYVLELSMEPAVDGGLRLPVTQIIIGFSTPATSPPHSEKTKPSWAWAVSRSPSAPRRRVRRTR